MSLSGFLPAVSRRAIVVSSAAVVLLASSGMVLKAQDPAAPAAAQAAPADPLKFSSAAARVVVVSFTADGAQAMDSALTMAKDALAKSDKPDQKSQAAHWKIIKGAPGADGMVVFVFVLDQTVANASYNPFVILQGAGLAAQEYTDKVTPLFTRVNSGIKGLFSVEGPVLDMAGAAAAGGHQ